MKFIEFYYRLAGIIDAHNTHANMPANMHATCTQTFILRPCKINY